MFGQEWRKTSKKIVKVGTARDTEVSDLKREMGEKSALLKALKEEIKDMQSGKGVGETKEREYAKHQEEKEELQREAKQARDALTEAQKVLPAAPL